ncbi:MAG: divergent polysaccharide deacetylase family protein [bacterium]|nr:divergent polysaccharide deacetylase family protein [bacterium]
MATKRRDLGLPVWAVACVLVLLAGGLAFWVWRPGMQMPEPIPEEEPGWRAGPEDIEAFSDSVAFQATRVLAGLGVPPDVIGVARLPENRGSSMRWEVKSEVPGGLPLAVCNLALTRLARRLGGDVLEGRENLKGTQLSLRIGLGEKGTDMVTLRMNSKLERRTGRIAIILDDFGYQNRELIAAFCALEQRVTLSIFPNEKHTVWTAQTAAAQGHGVMVHLPMEPLDYPARDPGPGAIFTDYSAERIQEITRHALQKVPDARGVNNHMGSRLTAHREATQAVLQEVARQGFFFVDSWTSPRSIAFAQAQEMGIPSARNALFLDRREETEAVILALYRLASVARQEGTVVGIGHAKRNTLAALQQVLPELAAEGFEFIQAESAVR